MKIGYLHLGPPEHGVCRYGRLLAQAAKSRADQVVLESEVILSNRLWQNLQSLYQAAKYLSQADVVHFQYNTAVWGGSLKFLYLWVFIQSCRCPLVVTLHDVYWQQLSFQWQNPIFYLKAMYGPTGLAMRLILQSVATILVCTTQEANRLQSVSDLKQTQVEKIRILPHFVETRSGTVDPHELRRSFNLENKQIITLLGWIHPRKGHQILLEALPKLPETTQLIFAGQPSPESETFVANLRKIADCFNVSDRLLITGYLSENQLEQYLAITDVAVCPFTTCSASGSLSTWISVAHPNIVVSKLPQIEEYNQLVPGALYMFEPYTPDALAQTIKQRLDLKTIAQNLGIERLREKLAMPNTLDRHLLIYEKTKSLEFSSFPTKMMNPGET